MSQHTITSECRCCGQRKRVPLRVSVCADCTRVLVSLWAEAANKEPEAAKACGYRDDDSAILFEPELP